MIKYLNYNRIINNETFQYLLITLIISHIISYFLIKISNVNKEKTLYTAYVVASTPAVTYVTYLGFVSWFTEIKVDSRTMIYNDAGTTAEKLIFATIAYQLWNLLSCLVTKEVRNFPFLAHHFMTLFLASFAFKDENTPFLHYYGVFFFGVSEISTIPLIIVDLFKSLPKLKERYDYIYQLSSILFAICYFPARIIYWNIVNYDLWTTCYAHYRAGNVHSYFIMAAYLLCNIALTMLQFLWGYLLIKKLIRGCKRSKVFNKNV